MRNRTDKDRWKRDSTKDGDKLRIGARSFDSRLLIGTGKYRDFEQTRQAVEASGAEIVTVAIRRTNIGQNAGEPSLLDHLPPERYTILPNTAGCYSAEDAVRTLRLARELLDGHDFVKLEVLGDPHTLYPEMPQTLRAAETLVRDGFQVLVYCSDDPIQAKVLEIDRLRRRDAAGVADRLRHGHPQSLEPATDPRAGDGAGDRRCRRRHGLGCHDRDGDGLCRRADEHGRGRGARPGDDGQGNATRCRGRTARLARRSDAAQDVQCHTLVAHRGPESPVADACMPRPIRSYVLRRSHFSPAQRDAYQRLMPRLGLAADGPRPLDLPAIFGREAPVIVDIGFGMGDVTAQIAERHPQQDFIGIEVHTPGIGALMRRIEASGLTNIRVIEGDADVIIDRLFRPDSITGIHLFFPDPWPKKRHHKRRLIQKHFVTNLCRKLRPDGYLHLATDWPDYAEQMIATVDAVAGLQRQAPLPMPEFPPSANRETMASALGPISMQPRSLRPATKFELRGLRLGHPICDILAVRCPARASATVGHSRLPMIPTNSLQAR